LCTREGEEWGLLKLLLLLLTLLVLLLVREGWGKTGGRPGGEVEVEEEEGGFSLLAEEKVNEVEGMMPMEACARSGRGPAMLLLLLLLLLAAPNAKPCVGINGGSGGQKGGGWEGKWRREAPRSFFLAHSCLRRSC